MREPIRDAITRIRVWLFVLVPLGALAYAVGGDDARVFGLSVLMFSGILLFVSPVLNREAVRTRKLTDDVISGGALVHWMLPEDTWAAWLEEERRRGRREAAGVAAICLAVWVGICLGTYRSTRELPLVGLAAVIAGLVAAVMVGATVAFSRHRLRGFSEGPREVVVGPGSLVLADTPFAWHDRAPFWPGGLELQQAIYEPQPPPWVLLVWKYRRAGFLRPFPKYRLRLPVPPGHEHEAQDLVLKLRAARGGRGER